MFITWTASASTPGDLARAVETHLNEFAGEVVSVSYAVDGDHHALLVYRPIESVGGISEEAVAVAEQIIDESHV